MIKVEYGSRMQTELVVTAFDQAVIEMDSPLMVGVVERYDQILRQLENKALVSNRRALCASQPLAQVAMRRQPKTRI